VLLAVPALRALRAASPDGRVALAAQPRLGALLADLGVVDEVAAFDGLGLGAFFTDAAVADRTLAALRSPARTVCWFGASAPAFVRRITALVPGIVVASPTGTDGLVWEHLLASTGPGRRPEMREPLAVPAALVDAGRAVLAAAGWDGATPVVLVHPGAGGPAKRWPTDGFAAIGRALGERGATALVVHRGPADGDAVDALMSRPGVRALVLVEPPLSALAGVLARVRGYVGNDSGVSHLAAAVGAPAVVLFTPATLRWRPWSDAARILTVSSARVEADDVQRVEVAVGSVVG
jgi:ADP-heptose:LPS heptosyltransferase